MAVDRNGLVVLDHEECFALLRANRLGRVAVSIDALPVIFPVQYGTLGDDAVVFRTSIGTKLDAALRGAVVAFEVDGVDDTYRRGWSVLVTGRAAQVIDPDEVFRCEALNLQPWLPDEPDRFVRVAAEVVSGRLIAPMWSPVAV